MAEYLVKQQKEREAMEWFTNEINNNAKKFKEEFLNLHIIDQCKMKAFIQVRDKKLYEKMVEILEE